jgi:hypothetical protein
MALRVTLISLSVAGGVLCFLPLFTESPSLREHGLVLESLSSPLWIGSMTVSLTLSILLFVDLILEHIPRVVSLVLFGSVSNKDNSSDKTANVASIHEKDVFNDSERLLFIMGMLVSPITSWVQASSSPQLVQDFSPLAYNCGRMSQICMTASALVLSLHRLDSVAFPGWMSALLVLICITGTVGGAFPVNGSLSQRNLIEVVCIVFASAVVIALCVRWLVRTLRSMQFKQVGSLAANTSKKSAVAPEGSVAEGAAETTRHERSNKTNKSEGTNVFANNSVSSKSFGIDLYVVSQCVHTVSIVCWLALLIASILPAHSVLDFTGEDLFFGIAPCIALQVLMLIVSIKLVKFKAIDALVRHVSNTLFSILPLFSTIIFAIISHSITRSFSLLAITLP